MDIFEMKQIEMNESEWLEDVPLSEDGMLKMMAFVRRVPGGWIYEYVTVRCEREEFSGRRTEVESTAMSSTFVPTPVPVSSW